MNLVTKIGKLLSIRPSQPLEKRLVEAESEIGGRLIPTLPHVKHQRFWYYRGYWHYEEQYISGSSSVVSYQFTDLQAYKLFNGREIELTGTELTNVRGMIKKYHEQIKSELYSKQAPSAAV